MRVYSPNCSEEERDGGNACKRFDSVWKAVECSDWESCPHKGTIRSFSTGFCGKVSMLFFIPAQFMKQRDELTAGLTAAKDRVDCCLKHDSTYQNDCVCLEKQSNKY